MSDAPQKTIIVKSWKLRLRNGAIDEYNIREDQDESQRESTTWLTFKYPKQKRFVKVRVADISAVDYQEIERMEMPLYKPKAQRGKNAESEIQNTVASQETSYLSYVPKTQ